jgi:hypothetical protein
VAVVGPSIHQTHTQSFHPHSYVPVPANQATNPDPSREMAAKAKEERSSQPPYKEAFHLWLPNKKPG